MQKTASETFGYNDLSSIYRVEKKNPPLSSVRRDLYHVMAKLLKELNTEYAKQLALDPESIICEGVNQRRKKSKQLIREIVELRMEKISKLALMGAMGANNSIDQLTPEEKDYYAEILNASNRHAVLVFRLSDDKKYESMHIDAIPAPKADIEPAVPKRIEPIAVPEREVEKPAPIREAPLEIEEMPPEDEEVDMEATVLEAPVRKVEKKTPVTEVEYEPEMSFGDDEESSDDDDDAPVRKSKSRPAKDAITIRITEDLPEFSGPDRDYLLAKEDVITMPKVMADALINRGKAVLLHPSA